MSSALIVMIVPSETLGIARLHVWDEASADPVPVESQRKLFVSGDERRRALAEHPDAFWMLPVPRAAAWELHERWGDARDQDAGHNVPEREPRRRSLERFLNARLSGWRVLSGARVYLMTPSTDTERRPEPASAGAVDRDPAGGSEDAPRRMTPECGEMFDEAFRAAAHAGMEAEVALEALHEAYALTRKHPDWTEQQVFRVALGNARAEWDV